jgi:hypothetical protein
MVHPFLWVSESSRWRVFWVFSAFAIALLVILQFLGSPLKTAAAPAGIVSYELAGTAVQSQRILETWDATRKAFAALNLGLDYLFIVSYAGAIGLGCSLLAGNLRRRFRRIAHIGVTLAWAQLLAAAFDSLENFALLKLLLGSVPAAWPAVARACAIPKFLIVLLGLGYLLVALVFTLAETGRGTQPAVRR